MHLLLVLPLFLQPAPDTIYYNANVVTGTSARAQAIAIRGNRFIAAGSTAEIRKLAGPATKQIDLEGRTVLPGL
ncbi:MAG: amidohydrolase, partial [Bryobacteraceae bacterium]